MKIRTLLATSVVLVACLILPLVTSASRKVWSYFSHPTQVDITTSADAGWLRLRSANQRFAEDRLTGRQQGALSLASGDFDEDGTLDLVSGFATEDGGVVLFQRGNVDSLFPHTVGAKQRQQNGSSTDSPFYPEAQALTISNKADFLAAGDFDADGHWDVVAATRGGRTLSFLRGDGRGRFSQATQISLPGSVTTLVTGDVNRRDGLTDILVGINRENNSGELLIYEGAVGALKGQPESFSLPGEITGIGIGQLDDGDQVDFVVSSEKQLVLFHGRDRRTSLDDASRAEVKPALTSHMTFQNHLLSIAVGDFTGDSREEIATLEDDGSLRVIQRVETLTPGLSQTANRLQLKENEAAAVNLTLSAVGVPKNSSTRLVTAKVSSLPKDDLVVVDGDSRQLHVITSQSEADTSLEGQPAKLSERRKVAATIQSSETKIALLPIRLESSALQSLVMSGNDSFTVLSPAVGATVTVNSNLVSNTRDAVLTINEAIRITNGTLSVATLTAQEQAQVSGTPTNPGLDSIRFNIPGTGVPLITDSLLMPEITDAVILDGTTQSAGRVALDSPSSQAAIRISSGNSTVRGMVINRSCRGLQLITNGNNVVEGNLIGTSIDGLTAVGNSCNHIEVNNSPNNRIGGTTAAARNVLSGSFQQNNTVGISISGTTASGNVVQGNYVGPDITGNGVIRNRSHGIVVGVNTGTNNTIGGTTAGAGNVIAGNGSDTIGSFSNLRIQSPSQLVQGNFIGLRADGTAALDSQSTGVSILSAASNTIGGTTPAARNVISGNGTGGTAAHGILLGNTGSVNCLIQGNYIGTNATGTAAVRNLGHGVSLNGVLNETIGGAVPGAGNVISGNILDGVHILHVALVSQTGNQVQGNFIGTDATGTLAIGNQSDGIELGANTGGIGFLIGGNTVAARNVISGNREQGIHLTTAAKANPTRIEGNYIGTNAFGTGAVGNGQAGIFFNANCDGHHIGGTAAGTSNVIAFNTIGGIISDAGRLIGGVVFANSIFSNGGLGIDRESNGVSPGATNRSDNPPVLTSVNTSGNTTTINGTLQQNHFNSVTYTIRFFSNVACDPSGFGEGQTYLGETTVNITNSNPVNFSANISPAVPGGRYLTAIALGPNTFDATGPSFTSEFSFCRQNNGNAPADPTALQLYAVAPNHGGNIGPVTSTITGEGIAQGATVLLRRQGESDIVATSLNVAANGSSVRGVFDLTGKALGLWDVVVTNPNSTSATLSGSFTIEAGRPENVWADLVGRTAVAVFPPHDERYFVLYGNTGNVDSEPAMLRLFVPKEMEVRFVDKIGGREPVIIRVDDGSGTFTAGKYIEFYLPTIPADSSGALLVLLRPVQISSTSVDLSVWGYTGESLELASAPQPNSGVTLNAHMNAASVGSFDFDIDFTSPSGNGSVNVKGVLTPVSAAEQPTVQINRSGAQIEYVYNFTMPGTEVPPFNARSLRPQLPNSGIMKVTVIIGSDFLDQVDITPILSDTNSSLNKILREAVMTSCLDLAKKPNGLPVIPPAELERMRKNYEAYRASEIGRLGANDLPPVDAEQAKAVLSALSQIHGGMFEQQAVSDPNVCGPLGGLCNGLNSNSTAQERLKAIEEMLQKMVKLCPKTCPLPTPTPTPNPFGSSPSWSKHTTQGSSSGNCDRPTPFRRDVPIRPVSSIDPNDKVGSAGTSDQHYIRGVEPFRYEIMFENLASATAAAKQVVITDQLDLTKFDLNTFELGAATFGSQVLVPPAPGLKAWSVDLDLRPSRNTIVRLLAELDMNSGIATWRFVALDPATGQISTAPDGGFLPPNQNQPEGSGAVFFTIKPKTSLAEGTQVRNRARIVFDANAPIDTPEWLNTIDNTLPTSQVQTLAATQPATSFTVNWSGSDAGSGVAGYSIFVSENGGPFNLWLYNVQTTSGIYLGNPDTTYGFYSIVTDGAANQETAKSNAEATTRTPAITPGVTSIQLSATTYNVTEQGLAATVTVTRTGDTSGVSSVDYATSDLAGSNSCATVNGNASSRCDYITARGKITFAQSEVQKTVTVLVTDDAYAEGSETFNVTLSNPVGGTLGATSTATVTITDNEATNGTNPIDIAAFFVRQHYLDFLNREPDAGGLAFWTNEITSCGADTQCREVKRINVSAAFFLSIEFQETGYLVYRMYKAGLGNLAGAPVPVRFAEFLQDTQQIGAGVQVGIGNWQQQLEANKQAYATQFVQRAEFLAAFPNTMTATEIVAKLNTNMGGVMTTAEQQNLVAQFGGTPADLSKRATVLRAAAETESLRTAEFNRAFVLMQYFGYLRRNPNDQPDTDFGGYNFWLGKLNSFGGNFVNAEMVKAFILSGEYRQRFGP